MKPDAEEEAVTISDGTKLPLRVVVVICSTLIALTVAVVGAMNAIRSDIATLKKEILPREEFSEWRDTFADENPTVKIPRVSRTVKRL